MLPTAVPAQSHPSTVDQDAHALLERLLDLWTNPVDDAEEMRRRFLAVYTDPVRINGADLPLDDLVARARQMAGGLADVHREVLEVLAVPGRVAFGFRLTARHVGPLPTPLGPVPATGEALDILGIDLLQLAEDGRITAITVLSGLMDVLASVGAVQLRDA